MCLGNTLQQISHDEPHMQTSADGRKFIEMKEESGVAKTVAYNDGTGTWTIGFGHTSAAGLPRVYPGMTITTAEADAILGSDLASVENDINHNVKVPLNQNQFDALVSFDFNTGALDRSGLLQLINGGVTNPQLITNAFEAWRYAHVHGVMVPILLGRRQDEAKLYLTPVTEQAAVA
jgi:lysozyme